MLFLQLAGLFAVLLTRWRDADHRNTTQASFRLYRSLIFQHVAAFSGYFAIYKIYIDSHVLSLPVVTDEPVAQPDNLAASQAFGIRRD